LSRANVAVKCVSQAAIWSADEAQEQ
jgi:hypothetical protein